MHGLKGYNEIIETISWGLQQLGHGVTYAINEISTDAANIVFGAQTLPFKILELMPRDSIIYNFEQMRGLDPGAIREELKYCGQHFQIWDYSPFNIAAWEATGPKYPVKVVPIGHAPVLERIPKPAEQDIDILFYGSTAPSRLAAFDVLAKANLTSVYVCGLYGDARDQLIARSKIVLNINYLASNIFEVARVSYLLSNKKAVVSLQQPGAAIEEDLLRAVKFSPPSTLLQDCIGLIDHVSERCALEEAGYSIMARRDIRPILASAVAE